MLALPIRCFCGRCSRLQIPLQTQSQFAGSGLTRLNRTLLSVAMQEAEPSEPRSVEVTRRPKAAALSASKRPKKEAKKKR